MHTEVSEGVAFAKQKGCWGNLQSREAVNSIIYYTVHILSPAKTGPSGRKSERVQRGSLLCQMQDGAILHFCFYAVITCSSGMERQTSDAKEACKGFTFGLLPHSMQRSE